MSIPYVYAASDLFSLPGPAPAAASSRPTVMRYTLQQGQVRPTPKRAALSELRQLPDGRLLVARPNTLCNEY